MKPETAMLEDRKLIEQTLAGQTESFDVLVDRHQSSLRRRIRSLAMNAMNEDDLVQQVFLKAWIHLANFRFEASFRTWILSIASNEVMQLGRQEGRSPLCPALVELDSYASKFESTQQFVERMEARQRVRVAIARLPAKYRQILVLCDLKELSAIETARALQASIPSVKTRLFRARRMLSTALHREERRFRRLVNRDARSSSARPHLLQSNGRD